MTDDVLDTLECILFEIISQQNQHLIYVCVCIYIYKMTDYVNILRVISVKNNKI